MSGEIFTFYMPVRLYFGAGELKRVGEVVAGYGGRALLVTGTRSMKALGVTEEVRAHLRRHSVESVLFDRVMSNPTDEVVDEGAALATKERVDVVVGLGGGSAMDAAKGIAVVAGHGGRLWDYIGEDKVPGEVMPIVAIPTTAGTGSEVTPYSVFTRRAMCRKDALVSEYTYPSAGIVDPILMRSMPPDLTADTAFDAMAHAVEAYLSPQAGMLSDLLGTEAVRLIHEALPSATANGEDLEARNKLALASSLAGMAIAQAGVVAGHGIGMSIGGILETSHGRTVGVLLPHVVAHNAPEIPERVAGLAEALGVRRTGRVADEASAVVVAITDLMEQIGFPTRLGALGVEKQHLERIVDDCMSQDDVHNNPRAIDRAEARRFLESIL